jgi:hypothetical protein
MRLLANRKAYKYFVSGTYMTPAVQLPDKFRVNLRLTGRRDMGVESLVDPSDIVDVTDVLRLTRAELAALATLPEQLKIHAVLYDAVPGSHIARVERDSWAPTESRNYVRHSSSA